MHAFWTWQQLDETEAPARAKRISQLAQEGGVPATRFAVPISLLRSARRSSLGARGPDAAGNTGCTIM